MHRIALLAIFSLAAIPARADRCADVLARIGNKLVDATCVHTDDLTTNGPITTPANNFISSLPAGAITPVTDRGVISPKTADKTVITKSVPGVQINGFLASDLSSPREARFLLRLPDTWNGRLVVAGASGTRSEFNGDWAWSDYVIQKGYAYASQNKGVLNLTVVSTNSATPPEPLACRLNPISPTSQVWVHFYDNDPQKPFWEWQLRIVEAAVIAKDGVRAAYGDPPKHTYAVGTSNGGYQVRRAIELAPGIFDGGVDWEGTFVDGEQPNLLTDLPPAIKNYPEYAAPASGPAYSANSTAAQNIRAAGYPPDITKQGVDPKGNPITLSLWGNYYAQFWEVTQCQWQKRLDPGYDTYGSGTGTYDYFARTHQDPTIERNIDLFETTGHIKAPLITVAGTMDALLPIEHHARAYADKVAAAHNEKAQGRVQYRLYEVQNGNHIETYKDTFPQLEYIQPHAQRAFDLLVNSVEEGAALPASQCIPRGGSISGQPAQPGRCSSLFVP